MAPYDNELVLPRPGTWSRTWTKAVPAPTEAVFTAAFGTLRPLAKYLNTDDGKAAYYELLPSTSVGNASTLDRVLFVHGVQTPALGMLPLARALHESSPHAHFVLVDLWGHGLSDTPIVPHTASLFLKLLNDLLDHLAWPSAHLVGFSFGGATTAGYVASRPTRVQSFILIAPAGLLRFSDFSPEQQAHLIGSEDEVAAHKRVLEMLEGGELVVPKD